MNDPREYHSEENTESDRRHRRRQISVQLGEHATGEPMRFQLRRSVYCRRCSYDLRLLDVESRCPECGLDIWPSVMHVVDPTASKLPQLRQPRSVGNALVWLFSVALLASLLLAASGVLTMVNALPPSGMRLLLFHIPFDLPLLSALAALSGLWAVWKFLPPRGNEPDIAVRRDLWLLAIALLIWAAICIGLWERERTWARMGLMSDAEAVIAVRSLSHLALAFAATLAMLSVRGLLRVIGSRSREYRRARGGRQGIKPMIVSILGVAVGSGTRYLGTLDALPDELQGLGGIIVWVSMLMLVIGLGYLLVNAWWIRRVLRRPPPQLRDLLQSLPEGDDGAGLPRKSDWPTESG